MQLKAWGKPGTWGTGAERIAVAVEARRACVKAGVLEFSDDFSALNDVHLPSVIKEVIAQLAVSPKDIDQAFYNNAISAGLTDAEFVEIVGLVARITNLDIFARGIGSQLKLLPAPEPGEPSRKRPPEAKMELAWVPTVPNAPDGGLLADEPYGGQPKPYIMRAMSLVPDEVRLHVGLEQVQYLPLQHILTYDYQHHNGLTRAQAELVAGRVSALNECFY